MKKSIISAIMAVLWMIAVIVTAHLGIKIYPKIFAVSNLVTIPHDIFDGVMYKLYAKDHEIIITPIDSQRNKPKEDL